MISASWSSWANRFRHRWADIADMASFSLCPFKSWNTQIVATHKCTLTIEQWQGAEVGSGGVVWGGARRLATYLRKHGDGCAAVESVDAAGKRSLSPAVAARPWSELSVLELGSGTGAAGLVAAALGARCVTLTDQAAFVYPSGVGGGKPRPVVAGRTLLDLMRRNVAAFHQTVGTGNRIAHPAPEVRVRELVWGETPRAESDSECGQFDVICASDVLLFREAHEALAATLEATSGAETVVLIEHTDRLSDDGHAYPDDLLAFLRLVELGALWNPQIVRDYGRHITLRMVRAQRIPGVPPFSVARLAPRASSTKRPAELRQ